nr:hypothetical protein [Actinocatenispora comari]
MVDVVGETGDLAGHPLLVLAARCGLVVPPLVGAPFRLQRLDAPHDRMRVVLGRLVRRGAGRPVRLAASLVVQGATAAVEVVAALDVGPVPPFGVVALQHRLAERAPRGDLVRRGVCRSRTGSGLRGAGLQPFDPVSGSGGAVGFPLGGWPPLVVDLDGDLVPGRAQRLGRSVDVLLLCVLVAATADENPDRTAPGEPVLPDDLVHPVAFG